MVFDEGALEEVPDVDADRDAWPIVGWAMEPGDAVAFNMLTLHARGRLADAPPRVSLRVTGDDVRWAPRPHRTSPPYDELDACSRRATRSTTSSSPCSGGPARASASCTRCSGSAHSRRTPRTA